MTESSRLAGLLLFIGATEFLVGMIVAESLYPGYNVALNYISDLGANCPSSGSCLIYHPTAEIFNGSAIFLGLLAIVSSFLLWRAYKNRILVPLAGLAGIGVLGVGLFPETTGIWHYVFSFIAFFFAGVSGIAAYKVEKRPFNYLSVIVGAGALMASALYVNGQYAGLGPGGMERMIAYPELIFAIAFGAHLMGKTEEPTIAPPIK